jgi:hypothetical protein
LDHKSGKYNHHSYRGKKEDINQGIAQNAIQLQTSIQRNPKKRSYDTAGLHEDVMYEIVSTAVDWVIIKLVSSSSKNNSGGKVEVLLSSLSPSPLPINNSVLTREDLAKPVKTCLSKSSECLIVRPNHRD